MSLSNLLSSPVCASYASDKDLVLSSPSSLSLSNISTRSETIANTFRDSIGVQLIFRTLLFQLRVRLERRAFRSPNARKIASKDLILMGSAPSGAFPFSALAPTTVVVVVLNHQRFPILRLPILLFFSTKFGRRFGCKHLPRFLERRFFFLPSRSRRRRRRRRLLLSPSPLVLLEGRGSKRGVP